MYKIEKGIKIKKSPAAKYPFHDMEIGDSFLAEEKTRKAAWKHGKKHNKTFVSRKVGEQWRIFRVA